MFLHKFDDSSLEKKNGEADVFNSHTVLYEMRTPLFLILLKDFLVGLS
jgi:hypothetical protein